MQRFVLIADVFKGRHFDRQIIVLCVRWYTSFKLSLRDLVIVMADRGISVTHTTILRSVQRYVDIEQQWCRQSRGPGKQGPQLCSPGHGGARVRRNAGLVPAYSSVSTLHTRCSLD